MKKNIIYIVCGIVLLYLLVCWIDIASHNNSSQKYGKWNIIYLMFNKEDKTEDDITTSEYPTETVTTEATTEEITTEVTTIAKKVITTEQTTVTTTEATTEITTEEVTTTEYTTESTTEVVTEQQTEEPTTVIATTTDASIDEYELWLLAHLINGEAGATWCSDTTRYYVGSVVLNRVNHAEFPDSIEGVIYQSGQYSCTWDGNFDLEPSDRCWEIARDLLINGSGLPNDVVFQANFSQGSGVYDYIDGVYFCYR